MVHKPKIILIEDIQAPKLDFILEFGYGQDVVCILPDETSWQASLA
jgi:hypothetical protein